jgi:hypothetical protein
VRREASNGAEEKSCLAARAATGIRAQVWAGCDDKSMSHEMFRYLPWPFPNNEFPTDLGAVVMRSVLDGVMPALQVFHDSEGGGLLLTAWGIRTIKRLWWLSGM